MRVAGVMSGTSLDGIDVAIVDIAGKRIDTVAHSTFLYSNAMRDRILTASNPQEISRLNFELGELYAEAVKATWTGSIDLAGCRLSDMARWGGSLKGSP